MKKMIFLLSCFIITIFVLANLYSSQSNWENDSNLYQLKKLIPKNWLMFAQDNKLIIERKNKVWLLTENKINAPLRMETDEELIKKIKKYGKKIKLNIIFRYELKWSEKKIKEVIARNKTIYQTVSKLDKKYHINQLKIVRKGTIIYLPRNSTDRKNLAAYHKEKNHLQKQIIRLPDYLTEKYSLFIAKEVDFRFCHIYPKKAEQELFNISNKVNKLLIKVK